MQNSCVVPKPFHKTAWLLTSTFGTLLSLAGHCQNTVGTILGTASSADGAAIPHASVTVTNESTHASRNLMTDNRGEYVVSDLNPGTYTVSARAPGFAAFQNTGIVLQAQQTIRIDIPLKIGSVAAKVEVTAGAPVIEAEMPSISTTVTAVELTQTSSNLLGIVDSTGDSGLLYYTPLLPTGHLTAANRWSLAGSTSGEAYYNVDGISSNSTIYGNVEGPAFPSFEIIQEVQNGAVDNKAEMGQLSNVTVITKSGTDQFHGSAFEHFGNQNLVAQNYFSTSNPSFTNSDFGAGIGGPILRRKIYFFASYEGVRNDQPVAINPNLPTLAFRGGDFSSLLSNSTPIIIKNPYTGQPFPGNIITPSLLSTPQSEAAQKWQAMFYPAPNYGPATGYVGNFRATYPQSSVGERIDLRFDANLSPTNTAFVRFSYNRAAPQVLDSGLPPSITGYRVQDRKTYSGVLSDTWAINSNLLNLAKLGAVWSNNGFHPILEGQGIIDNLGIQGLPVAPATATGFPTLSISSITSPGKLGPANGTEQTVQITDQLTYQRRNHTIKSGFEYRPQFGTLPAYPSFGSFTFNGSESGFAYADFLLGLPQATSYSYLGPSVYARQYFLSAFTQDDWRALPDLMLSIGLRYDFDSAGVDKYNHVSIFDAANGSIVVPSLANTQQFIPPGFPAQIPIMPAQQAGLPARSLRNAFKGGFYPRLGFAYDLNKKTVIRGAYGVYNNDITIHLFTDLYQAPYGGTVAYTNSIEGGSAAISFTNPINAGSGKLGAVNMTGIDKSMRNPFVQQWNLTVERDLGFNTGLRLSYIGLKGALLYTRNLNQVQASATVPWSQANTPYPAFQTLNQISNGGSEVYNAFTAEVKRNLKSNLLFEAAFTWAKNLTDDPDSSDVEAGVTAEDTYNLRRQWGNDTYTPRYQFVSNLLYSLPVGHGQMLLSQDNLWSKIFGGWQLSAAYLANTGNYLTPLFSGVDPTHINAFKGSASRTNISSSAIGKQSINNWFNPAAYAIPQAGQFGNTGYGTLKGPDSQVLNSALFKSFPVWRETNIQISGSFTNVLNHPNFGNPDVTITDTTVGKITSVQGSFFGPRSGLLSVRYTF
ncbi:MAG: TonB-dependent receptor [Acidobacteriaceae bacterium]